MFEAVTQERWCYKRLHNANERKIEVPPKTKIIRKIQMAAASSSK